MCLIGSYSTGRQREDSDLDILFVLDSDVLDEAPWEPFGLMWPYHVARQPFSTIPELPDGDEYVSGVEVGPQWTHPGQLDAYLEASVCSLNADSALYEVVNGHTLFDQDGTLDEFTTTLETDFYWERKLLLQYWLAYLAFKSVYRRRNQRGYVLQFATQRFLLRVLQWTFSTRHRFAHEEWLMEDLERMDDVPEPVLELTTVMFDGEPADSLDAFRSCLTFMTEWSFDRGVRLATNRTEVTAALEYVGVSPP